MQYGYSLGIARGSLRKAGAPGVPPPDTAPAQFAAGDWTLTTGLSANELVLSVSSLPADGGSVITALQYTIDGGTTWTALPGTGTGARTLTMPAAGTAYTVALRAVNAIGNGTASATKPATSGATVAAPITITSAQPTAQRVYQRSSDTGGTYSLGTGPVPISITVDQPVSSLQYRLRDAQSAAVLVDWTALSGALASGTHSLSPTCPARLGQYLIDVRANGDSAAIATGTNPFAVGAVILSAGQSQAMRTFGVVGGAATPIATSGATIPAFGRVFGTYFDTQRTSSTPAWVAPADGTAYDSPFIPTFLAAEQARRGVTCAYVGCGVGASLAAEWVPGQTNWTRLLVSINEADAWEGFIWHLGGSDATGGTTAASYTASLNSILTALDGLNGRGSDYDAVICAMGSRTTGDWDAVARIRQAAKDVAEARAGAIYAEPRDVDLVDAVHQSDAGNIRLARSMSRHLAAAAAGAIAGPTITGATLDGAALTVAVTHAPGATALVATGDITTRLAVYPAGYVPTTGTTGRLAISAATVTANAINITLASAPTTEVDVYVYPHPDTTGTTISARVIGDNYTADGIPHGRQALPTTDAPVTADYTGVVTPPAPSALSVINFTSPTYDATFQTPYNNVDADAPAPSIANILDVNGAATGLAFAASFTGSPVVGQISAPGYGKNNFGRTTGLSAYANNLHCTNVVKGNVYITAGVTLVMSISGAAAGASYEVGFVGSRVATETRTTTLTVEGVATSWNTSEDPPLERKVTVVASGDGVIDMVLARDGATNFAYLGGFSIQRLS